MQWRNGGRPPVRTAPEPPPETDPNPSPELVDLRMNGRPDGQFEAAVRAHFMSEYHEWPMVLADDEFETFTVPQTFLGLIAFVAKWDSLLSDDEYIQLHSVVEHMVPMGLNGQANAKKLEAEAEEQMEHIREHHPEMLREGRTN